MTSAVTAPRHSCQTRTPGTLRREQGSTIECANWATPKGIADNDINFNILRCVVIFEEEAEIQRGSVTALITRVESELAAERAQMQAYLEELEV